VVCDVPPLHLTGRSAAAWNRDSIRDRQFCNAADLLNVDVLGAISVAARRHKKRTLLKRTRATPAEKSQDGEQNDRANQRRNHCAYTLV
jgi:hypothetical protein